MSTHLAGRCSECRLKWSGPISEIPFVKGIFHCRGCGAVIATVVQIPREEASDGGVRSVTQLPSPTVG